MGLARNMMGGGIPSGMAQAINGSANLTVSAAGTTLGTATALTADHNTVTTVAAASGVSLADGVVGDSQTVYNATTTALTVYPATTSQTINQLSAGVGMQLAPYTAVLLKKVSSTAWVGWLSA